MSLQFIVGPSGSGKTTQLHSLIIERVKQYPNKNHIILVPEQFNMQTQRDICMASPTGGIMQIDVLSFTRLSHRIFDEAGGNNLEMLGDVGKSMILRRVAGEKREEMSVLSGKLDKPGYVSEMKSIISEFMQYDITPAEVDGMISISSDRPALCSKLKDINVLYRGYNDFLKEKYITSEEILDRAVALADKAPFLSSCDIYMDGYTGFTPVQLRFIRELLRRCDNVFVTVTLGSEAIMDKHVTVPEHPAKDDLFYLGKHTISSLRNICSSLKIKEEQVLTMTDKSAGRHSGNKMLAHLEENIFRNSAAKAENNTDNCIFIRECPDALTEAAYIGRQIYTLTHEEGYSYGEIAVLCGDMQQYERHLSAEFSKYNVPLFYDEKRDVLMNPFVEMLRAAVDVILRDFNYDSVFRYLRCSMTGYTTGQVDELENYVLGAGIKRKRDYNRQWTYMLRDMTAEELLRLNDMRVGIMDSFSVLMAAFFPKKKSKCLDMVTALYDFAQQTHCGEQLSGMAAHFLDLNDEVRSKEYEQIYRSVMDLFDSFATLIPEEMLTTREFMQILDAGFEELSVGVLPPGNNSVLVGDLERSRLSNVKVLILAGCNDGKIPKEIHKTGILSELDREILKERNIELAPGTREQAFIQRFYLYMYLTKPTDRLYITYSRISTDGKALMPSYLISTVSELYMKPDIESVDLKDMYSGKLLTRSQGYDRLAYCIGHGDDTAIPLFAALAECGDKDSARHLNYMRNIIKHAFRSYRDDPVRSAVCNAIFGNTLRGSVTRLEQYAQCAYAHFLKYGLRLKERELYAFEMKDLGSIYHEILCAFGRKLDSEHLNWREIQTDKAREIMGGCVGTVLDKYKDEAIFTSSRDSYNAFRIRSVMDKTAEILTYQIQKGSFTPAGYETKIEEYRKLDDISFTDGEKHDMRLSGSIDRIDECESGDEVFVRIIDYKSGNKDLDMAAIYEGTSLQLIVYMNNAVELTALRHKGKKIRRAGVLYYHIDDPVIAINQELDAKEIDAQIKKNLMMRGLVNSDDAITEKMDNELSERVSVKSDIIAVEYTKKGELSKHSKTVSDDDFDVISEYIKHKVDALSKKVLMGEIKPEPFESGSGTGRKTACDYCNYRKICGFDENVKGYEYRQSAGGSDEQILCSMREALGQ